MICFFDNFLSIKLFPHSLRSSLQLGLPVIFTAGFLLGPTWGVLIAFAADHLGLIFGINGGYSALFPLEKCLTGFLAGVVLVACRNRQQLWIYYYFLFFIFSFALLSLGINIWFYALIGIKGTKLKIIFLIHLIKLIPQGYLYTMMSVLMTQFIYFFCLKNLIYPIWARKYYGFTPRIWTRFF